MELVGVDFSSRPSLPKPVVRAHGRLDGARLKLTALHTHARLEDSRSGWLRRAPGSAPSIFRSACWELVEALGWPLEWRSLMAHYGALSRQDIRAAFAAFCDARPAGSSSRAGPASSPPARARR